jgi:hypothetical protein
VKALFAGPSLHGLSPDLSGVSLRAPAIQGDIAAAVLEGATAIGLVDGNFEASASVWHKEILFALAEGVTVLGASSMGALRAAECAPYGMKPVGAIALAYASGALDDDAAVALTHGPAELGYLPFTEPMVDVEPTLEKLRALEILSAEEYAAVLSHSRRLHFKQRTDEAMFAAWPERLDAYREHRVGRKSQDALLLISELKACPGVRAPRPDLRLQDTFFTRQILPLLQHADAA